MTAAELNEIEARANAATAGPWLQSSMQDEPDHHIVLSQSAKPGQNGICSLWESGWLSGNRKLHPGNGVFIAHAREDVPKLLAEVRRLRAIEDRLAKVFGKELSVAEFPTMGWKEFADKAEAIERDNDDLREQLGLKPRCWSAFNPPPLPLPLPSPPRPPG